VSTLFDEADPVVFLLCEPSWKPTFQLSPDVDLVLSAGGIGAKTTLTHNLPVGRLRRLLAPSMLLPFTFASALLLSNLLCNLVRFALLCFRFLRSASYSKRSQPASKPVASQASQRP
jgi:hypothetical protein